MDIDAIDNLIEPEEEVAQENFEGRETFVKEYDEEESNNF